MTESSTDQWRGSQPVDDNPPLEPRDVTVSTCPPWCPLSIGEHWEEHYPSDSGVLTIIRCPDAVLTPESMRHAAAELVRLADRLQDGRH